MVTHNADYAPDGESQRHRSRVWRFLTQPDELHDGMRLIDFIPVLVIGIVLVALWRDSDGWAVVVWFLLAFVSVTLTRRFIRTHNDGYGATDDA